MGNWAQPELWTRYRRLPGDRAPACGWWPTACTGDDISVTGFIFCFLETIRARWGDREKIVTGRWWWRSEEAHKHLLQPLLLLSYSSPTRLEQYFPQLSDNIRRVLLSSVLNKSISPGPGGAGDWPALHTGDVLRTDLGKIGPSHGNDSVWPLHFLLFATVLLRRSAGPAGMRRQVRSRIENNLRHPPTPQQGQGMVSSRLEKTPAA